MSTAPRRTQHERREATIAKLLDATIGCLIEHGYRDTSISRICDRAGLSQGGLFRHFGSRVELLAAATDEIGTRHLARLHDLAQWDSIEVDQLDEIVRYFRAATRDPLTEAWREILVAARTNEALRLSVAPPVKRLEEGIMEIASMIAPDEASARGLGTLLLSLLHMFDSEATAAAIVGTEDIEEIRHAWAVELLRSALGSG
jgi:AcrR family transcriptional regulator